MPQERHYCARYMLRTSIPPRPSAFFAIRVEDGWVCVVRSACRFESEAQIRAERHSVGLALDGVGRGGALLIDSRLAPPSTDFELGVEFRALRREVERGFERVAVLVQTKLGILQATRLKEEDPSRVMRVFDDEQEALVFLSSK